MKVMKSMIIIIIITIINIIYRVNSHVFEAFCFTLWSLIHYYPRPYLLSILHADSTPLPTPLRLLLTITLADANTNTRRAGAAVLQEAMGRGIWGVEDGIGERVSELISDESVRNHEVMYVINENNHLFEMVNEGAIR